MYAFSAFLIGFVFAAGLLVAGMTNPAKVLAFLDLAGSWDPSLALVMGAAIAVGLPGFYTARSRNTSMLGTPMMLPQATAIDRRLLAGAFLFGIGWGAAGFCPGPALVSVGAGAVKGAYFVVFMLAGMVLVDRVDARSSSPRTRSVTVAVTQSESAAKV